LYPSEKEHTALAIYASAPSCMKLAYNCMPVTIYSCSIFKDSAVTIHSKKYTDTPGSFKSFNNNARINNIPIGTVVSYI
jgi:hypothetical protein